MDAEAIVVGGGLAGLAAAIAVAQAGLSTIHLAPAGPRRPAHIGADDAERRLSAVGRADRATRPAMAMPLTQIRIIDATPRLLRAPETLFDAREAGLEAFGWNFANVRADGGIRGGGRGAAEPDDTRDELLAAFELDADGPLLTLADGATLRAPLVVGADGKKSLVRAVGRVPGARERLHPGGAGLRPRAGAAAGRRFGRVPLSAGAVHAGAGGRQPGQSGLDRRPRRAEGGAGARDATI